HIPHAARRQSLVDLAGNQAFVVRDISLGVRPFAPYELRGIVEVRPLGLELLASQRKRQLPIAVALHGLHEFIGDEQRQIELTQSSVLALRANELQYIGMPDIERAPLGTAAAAGR